MDWARAIERNSEALKSIVTTLFAMLGLSGTAALGRIPRALHASVLRLLRSAESAVRRLIVIAARGLAVKLPPSRPMPAGLARSGQGGGPLAFQLFDSRKRFDRKPPRTGPRLVPRIHFWPYDTLVARPQPKAPPEPGIDAKRLCRRLAALKLALSDLPRQARRLARWRLKREKMANPKFRDPLRPGRPPGHRKNPIHAVDEVLAECHWLAWEATRLDTS
jgi:hypothetical protein